MLKYAGRTATIALLLAAIATAVSIVVFLIAISLLGQERVIEGISCQLGVSETCLRQELALERSKLDAIQGRHDEMEALLERLASLDHAASSYVIFLNQTVRGKTVTTGHSYASLLDPNTLIGAHCYFNLDRQSTGGRIRYDLGDMSASKRISERQFSASALSAAGVTRVEIQAFQAACQWPDGAS